MIFNFPAKSYDKVANNFFLEIYSRFWEASKNVPRMHVYVWIRMRMNLQPDQERNDWLDHLKNPSDMLLSNAEHFVLYRVRRAIHITPVVLATKTLICLTCLGSRRMHRPCLRGEKALEVLPCEIRQIYRLAIHPRFRGLAGAAPGVLLPQSFR